MIQATECMIFVKIFLQFWQIHFEIFTNKFCQPVIEDGKTGLIIIFLQPLHSQTTLVFNTIKPAHKDKFIFISGGRVGLGWGWGFL